MIKKGYEQFANGLFEIPRTFRFGQVVLCQPELIEELKNKQNNLVSPEPWIDQVEHSPLLTTANVICYLKANHNLKLCYSFFKSPMSCLAISLQKWDGRKLPKPRQA